MDLPELLAAGLVDFPLQLMVELLKMLAEELR
jgi:hypothetical protein